MIFSSLAHSVYLCQLKSENMKEKYRVETCFTPALFPHRIIKENYLVVIVDILRATTSINAAFANEVEAIIPVASVEEAKSWKEKGVLVASERDGMKLDFADFGNSAFSFMTPEVKGKTIAYSTTNGTQAVDMAVSNGAEVVIGSFNNLTALGDWIATQQKNVVILCSGFKNKFCIEDAFFAGALADYLLKSKEGFSSNCDATTISMDMWSDGQSDILKYIDKAAHRERLRQRGQDDVLEYSFTIDNAPVVPVLDKESGRLINTLNNQ